MLKQVVILLTLVNILAFAWSVVGVFKKDTADWRLGLLKTAATAAGFLQIWQLYAHDGSSLRDFVALVMLGLSLWLYTWAVVTIRKDPFTLAFSADEPRRLEVSGPYRFIRNPFYTAYLMTYASGAIATMSWVNVAVLVTMSAIYINAVHMEERKFLQSGLADAYRGYQSSTGRFLPLLWSRARQHSP
jgi:protein-S-isoprenylcysteine O-methyltransferase Ste14